MKISLKQKSLLNFLEEYLAKYGEPPSLKEIANILKVKHLSTAHFHLRALEKKGLIKREKFNIIISKESRPGRVKFLGYISAGKPLLTFGYEKEIELEELCLSGLRPNELFILQVKGNSMIEEGLFDGDFVLVRKAFDARNGEIVVVLVDGEATVKKFYRFKDKVILKPANSELQPIVLEGEKLSAVAIQGVVVGLIRRYNKN